MEDYEQQPISELSRKNKPKKKKSGVLWLVILLIAIILGMATYFFFFMDNTKEEKEPEIVTVLESDGQVVKDYDFKDGEAVHVKPPNIGMAIKSAIRGNVNGEAEMTIKNSGDIDIQPQVMFNNQVIYTSPVLKKGEAVKAQLNFGKVEVGAYDFNVLASYRGGSGLSLKSKLVVE